MLLIVVCYKDYDDIIELLINRGVCIDFIGEIKIVFFKI